MEISKPSLRLNVFESVQRKKESRGYYIMFDDVFAFRV